MVVAVVCLVADLPHLHGTSLAAVTAIHEQTDPQRTGGGALGALAGPLAILRAVVWLQCCGFDSGWGGRHDNGILGVGLYVEQREEVV